MYLKSSAVTPGRADASAGMRWGKELPVSACKSLTKWVPSSSTMGRRHRPADPEWHAQAEALIAAFIAPTKRDRYLSKPQLLSENIPHSLERHLDPRRWVAIGSAVHTSADLVAVLQEALGAVEGGFCIVAGGYCPPEWQGRPVPVAELVADPTWWLSEVLFSFNGGAAAYFAAEEYTDATRGFLVANETQRARAVRAVESMRLR